MAKRIIRTSYIFDSDSGTNLEIEIAKPLGQAVVRAWINQAGEDGENWYVDFDPSELDDLISILQQLRKDIEP